MITTNILAHILKILSVKHTKDFTNQFYERHPNKYNLLGVSQMLDAYQVENIGVNIPLTADAISRMEPPFLACVSNHFVIVTHITDEKVSYLFEDNDINVPIENFLRIWSGDALLFAKTEDSIEPEYAKHQKDYLLKKILLLFGFLSIVFLCGVTCIRHWADYTNITILQLLMNVIGIALCIPLVRVQIHKYDKFTQKACSLFSKKSKCNAVTNSPASSVFGISLSSIGIAYFIVNFLSLIICPQVLPTLSLINIFLLPFTVWSIWYQFSRLKEFCSLCIGVQITIWIIFIINMLSYSMYEFDIWYFTSICCAYLMGILSVHTYSQYQIIKKEALQSNYQLHAIKSNYSIFLSLLQEQHRIETNINIGLLIGNPTSPNTIT